MAIDGFYTATITIAIAASVFLYQVLWKKSTDRIKELEGTERHESKFWLGDIWTNDIERAVREFHSFIQESIAETESEGIEDKFGEIFLNERKIPAIREKLHSLTALYKAYSDSKNLLQKSTTEHEALKTWLLKTIALCFALAIWGAIGFLVESTALVVYSQVFWVFFALLITLVCLFGFNLVNCYQDCGRTDSAIRKEKSKHSDALDRVT